MDKLLCGVCVGAGEVLAQPDPLRESELIPCFPCRGSGIQRWMLSPAEGTSSLDAAIWALTAALGGFFYKNKAIHARRDKPPGV